MPIPYPTYLALFGHKITLYRFNQGRAHTIVRGAQIGVGRGLSPLAPPHFNHLWAMVRTATRGSRAVTGVQSTS